MIINRKFIRSGISSASRFEAAPKLAPPGVVGR